MSLRNERERQRLSRGGWFSGGWIAPTLVVVFTILWSLLIYHVVGDRLVNRTWQYGTPSYIPAESPATTAPASDRTPPAQVVLPKVSVGGGKNVRP